ncbi:START-like domain-containing protein [Lutibacter sp. TH_r2]|uniref:START-like domain-containing protein n=1 Tax=Lutibacter sp. TH_r2 TaxID=3082083 RepID=UPI0029545B0B|nr:START-like domain-containing protein [Lutibacter sp. TH_r2]MDV7188441.1 START-like domain-containing protein [Lutibacter sp. TH_r2]
MSSKVKFEIEFPIHASTKMLYQYFATPSGLSEWFADNVNSRGEMFTFIWDGSEEKAKVLQERPEEKIKFKWEEDEDPKSYFEFRLEIDDITKDVALIVTDFAEEDEVDEAKMFWENQIDELKHTIGA